MPTFHTECSYISNSNKLRGVMNKINESCKYKNTLTVLIFAYIKFRKLTFSEHLFLWISSMQKITRILIFGNQLIWDISWAFVSTNPQIWTNFFKHIDIIYTFFFRKSSQQMDVARDLIYTTSRYIYSKQLTILFSN